MRFLLIAIPMAIFSALVTEESTAQKLMGLVVGKNEKGVDEPIPGANVYWLGGNRGTTTRANGIFLIDREEGRTKLVIHFVGYYSDTLLVTDQTNVKVELKSDLIL